MRRRMPPGVALRRRICGRGAFSSGTDADFVAFGAGFFCCSRGCAGLQETGAGEGASGAKSSDRNSENPRRQSRVTAQRPRKRTRLAAGLRQRAAQPAPATALRREAPAQAVRHRPETPRSHPTGTAKSHSRRSQETARRLRQAARFSAPAGQRERKAPAPQAAAIAGRSRTPQGCHRARVISAPRSARASRRRTGHSASSVFWKT